MILIICLPSICIYICSMILQWKFTSSNINTFNIFFNSLSSRIWREVPERKSLSWVFISFTWLWIFSFSSAPVLLIWLTTASKNTFTHLLRVTSSTLMKTFPRRSRGSWWYTLSRGRSAQSSSFLFFLLLSFLNQIWDLLSTQQKSDDIFKTLSTFYHMDNEWSFIVSLMRWNVLTELFISSTNTEVDFVSFDVSANPSMTN